MDLATRWASAISLYSPDKLPLSAAVSRVRSAPVEVTEVTLNLLRAKLCCSSLVMPFCTSSSEIAAVSGGNGPKGFRSFLDYRTQGRALPAQEMTPTEYVAPDCPDIKPQLGTHFSNSQ